MDNSITQNLENKKRYLPHDLNTKIHAVEMYRNNSDIEYTCRKYYVSRYSLWRWNKKYDGTYRLDNMLKEIDEEYKF